MCAGKAMRLELLGDFERKMARCAAVIMIGSLAAGCSSGAMRFGGVDDVFTGSTDNQKRIINPGNQPYPVAAAPLDATPTGSVNRGALSPVALPPANGVAAVDTGVRTASLDPVARKPLSTGLDAVSYTHLTLPTSDLV